MVFTQKVTMSMSKAPVFSFTKLAKVDSLLGPEMKSTGEVMGTDATLEKRSTKLLKHLTSTCQPLVMSSLLFMMILKKKPLTWPVASMLSVMVSMQLREQLSS